MVQAAPRNCASKIINGRYQLSGDISVVKKIGILQNLNKWLDKTVYDFMKKVTGVKSARG